MHARATSRIFASALFLAAVLMATALSAQQMGVPGQSAQYPKGGQGHAAVESNPACQRILAECERLGFIKGQWKQDNGLYKDCFGPIVSGRGSPTRDGKPINVPVNPSDVQACRAAAGHHNRQIQ